MDEFWSLRLVSCVELRQASSQLRDKERERHTHTGRKKEGEQLCECVLGDSVQGCTVGTCNSRLFSRVTFMY
ncbi:hypothetical protein M758_6G091300 [Ceratodon purpureus]|nr:hypothetical protein M758_6G091300 [Ceratodon purpureus]